MSRTPEQVAATNKVTDAVAELLAQADAENDEPVGLLTEYVVVATQQHIDEDGDTVNTYSVITGGAGATLHSVVGLVEYARGRLGSLLDDE